MADNYNPVQTVAPSISSPNNMLSVRASPAAFGSEVGQAAQRLGATLQQAGSNQLDVEIKRQGLLNESYVADAETQLNTKYGEIDGWFKSLKGQEAFANHDAAVQKVQQVRQDTLKTLPNDAARKSFNLVAARAEGFVLRDYGNYVGGQLKAATTAANAALRENLTDQTSLYNIATNDGQLGYIEGSVNDLNRKLVEDSGWDLSTKEGQAILAAENDKVNDKIWTNITKAIAFDPEHGDPVAAYDKLKANQKSIPAATFARLSQELSGPYRSVKARDIANNSLAEADRNYNRMVTTVKPLDPIPSAPSKTDEFKGVPYDIPNKELNIPDTVNRFIQQESGGRGNNIGQIQPSTWQQFANPGEKVDNPSDNRAVMQRMLEQYSKDYHGDLARIAVAYFSGPGNVAPPGSTTAWKVDNHDKNGKSVSSYVADITKGAQSTAESSVSSPVYITKAEYYESTRGDIINKARAEAYNQFHDPRIADEAGARAEQRINDVIQNENGKKAADTELVRRFTFGEGNNGQLISNISQLENGPPEVRDAYHRMMLTNPLAIEALKNHVLTANSAGKALDYGTQFWDRMNDVVTGKIKSPDQLYNYVGPNKNSPLTNTGLSQLSKLMQLGQSPEGTAFLHSMQGYFQKLRTDIVGGINRHNARGEAIFQRAMMQAIPKIMTARGQGIGGEMFDEDSKDYPGGAASYDPRTLDQQLQDMISIQNPTTVGGLLPPETPKTSGITQRFDKITTAKEGQDTLRQFLHDRQAAGQELTPEEYKELHEYYLKRGWVTNTANPNSVVPVPR